MSNLSQEEISAIARETAQNLTAEYKQLWIDREVHYKDHLWIAEQKAIQEEDRAFKRKIANGWAMWAVIAVSGFVAISSWRAILDAIKTYLKTHGG